MSLCYEEEEEALHHLYSVFSVTQKIRTHTLIL